MFENCKAPKPWWFSKDAQQIKKDLQSKEFNDNLEDNLINQKNNQKKIKI